MVNYYISQLTYALFPGRCIVCDKASSRALDLCSGCENSLSIIDIYCRTCGLPTSSPATHCGSCIKHTQPFHRSLSLLSYDELAAKLIHQLKYNNSFATIKVLGDLFSQHITAYYKEALPQLIIPVPLHWLRLHNRSYNQAQLTAKYLGKQLGIKTSNHSCRRIKATPAQQNLNRAQRKKNIRGAFKSKQLQNISHVAIIDDVITTGETVGELTRSLQQHHPGLRVDVWSLARTPLK
ncbi:MAG: ComF family protein [Pseudomonadales bacterium]|jgi:ComF family protein